MCYHINFLFYVSYNFLLVSSAYIFFLRRIYKKSDTRGDIISISMRYTILIVRYLQSQRLPILPDYHYASLHSGAILFTLLIRNISRVGTDFNRSRTQLIKSILNIVIFFSNTVKNFINIMIQYVILIVFYLLVLTIVILVSSAYIFILEEYKMSDTRGDIISISMRYITNVYSVLSFQTLPILPEYHLYITI